jgi:hypothetical protein
MPQRLRVAGSNIFVKARKRETDFSMSTKHRGVKMQHDEETSFYNG